MYLTDVEEKILAGEYGYSYMKAMEILVALGKIYKADKLIEISSAHVSGVSYKNIGEEGLEFLKELSRNGRVKVKTTINPGGFDVNQWREMGVDRDFVSKQIEVIEAFRSMGIDTTLSCTPYYKENFPATGEHVAWAESSAVTLINSVVGAYTNRESGISALAAALIGKTPNYGLHTYEGRKPDILVDIEVKLKELFEYGVLGYVVSKYIGNSIPYFRNMVNPTLDMLKYLSASLATYGGIPIFHIEGVTPESSKYEKPSEKIKLDKKDIESGLKELRDELILIDMVWIGCPHASLDEIKYIAMMIDGEKLNKRLVITTSRTIYIEALKEGYIDTIRNAGGEVYADTCIIVSPIGEALSGVLTPSSKAYFYLKGVNKSRVFVASLDKCIEYALRGIL